MTDHVRPLSFGADPQAIVDPERSWSVGDCGWLWKGNRWRRARVIELQSDGWMLVAYAMAPDGTRRRSVPILRCLCRALVVTIAANSDRLDLPAPALGVYPPDAPVSSGGA